jgi:hypothetical protein
LLVFAAAASSKIKGVKEFMSTASLAERLSLASRLPLWVWPVLASFFVQVDVVGNHFIFDDYLHLYKMSNGPFWHTVLAPHGGHLLQSFNVMVWLVQHTVGANAGIYFLLALSIHLVSVRLVFEIVVVLTKRPALAAFGAALFGMSPFGEGSIGWMSVNGHVILTAAVLAVVLDVSKATRDPAHLTRRVLARDFILLLVAGTSFGTGFAAALAFGVVVAIWDPIPAQRLRVIGHYGAVALAAVLLYFATITLYGEAGGSKGVVDVVGRNLGALPKSAAMFGELVSFGAGGLLLGPVLVGDVAMVEAADAMGAAQAAAAFGAVFVIVALWFARPRERRVMLALLVLAMSGYGLIAFARYWAVEGASQLIRYHYLPPALFSLVLTVGLSQLLDRFVSRTIPGRRVFAVWLALAFVPAAMAVNKNDELMRIEQAIQFEQARAEIERALEAETDPFEVVIPNRPYFVRFFGGKPEDFPGLAAFFVMTHPDNVVEGRRVSFAATSRAEAEMASRQHGARIKELLVDRPDHMRRARPRPKRGGGS